MTEEEKVEEAAPPKRATKKAKASAALTPLPIPITPPVKRFSFDQWAARNNVLPRHRPGLRAFVNNVSKHRTLEEWEACFKGY